eukprot:scaffold310_cov335-Pavlova_lutheri.AAC.46
MVAVAIFSTSGGAIRPGATCPSFLLSSRSIGGRVPWERERLKGQTRMTKGEGPGPGMYGEHVG